MPDFSRYIDEMASREAACARDEYTHRSRLMTRAVLRLIVGAERWIFFFNRTPPPLILAIPAHGIFQTLLEGNLWLPAKRPKLGRIEAVPQVVPLAILHLLDERLGPLGQTQQLVGEVDVSDLVAASDVVHLAGAAAFDDEIDAATVIHDVHPVSDVEAGAVERHGNIVERVGDEERNDLLGKLIRPVVVGRPRDDDRNAVGRPVAEREAIGACLAGRVGVPRPQFVGLDARSLRNAAIDLVGRDLDEATEARRGPRRFEQHESADDIGLDELARLQNRAIDVRLRREMHHNLRRLDERGRDLGVGDVPANEPVARIVDDVAERLHTTGVGQFVQRRDAPVGMRLERMAHEIAADEAGAAGDQNFDHHLSPAVGPEASRSNIRGGHFVSRSDVIGRATGQSMPIAGSFHMMPASCSGEYSVEV